MHFKSKILNCWLILSNRVSCFEQDGSGQKSQCVTKSLLLEKQNYLNHHMAYFGQCISSLTKSQSLFTHDTVRLVLCRPIGDRDRFPHIFCCMPVGDSQRFVPRSLVHACLPMSVCVCPFPHQSKFLHQPTQHTPSREACHHIVGRVFTLR